MKYHRKLKRQLKLANLSTDKIEELKPLMDQISSTYYIFDDDMSHAETILEESSRELFRRNLQLRENVQEISGQLNRVASNIKDIIFEVDMQGNWVYLNSAFEEYTGIKTEDAIGTQAIDYIDAENKKKIFELVNKSSANRKAQSLIIEIVNKEGNPAWFEIGIKTVRSKNNIAIGYIGNIVNITNLKKTELQLIKAKEEEVKANKAKGEFLSIMSHEIRTPLNAVIGISNLLLIEEHKLEQVENLNTLKFSSEHLLSLINDILDYNKIMSGSLELEAANFSLNEVLNSIQSIFDNKAKKKSIDLQIVKPQLLQDTLIGDSTRLSQIFSNLVSNAIKFTQEGIVRIEVEVINETEDISELKFTISDTGIGIRKEQIDHIFDSFVQADVSTTRHYGGTGLGLAICKELVEMMGASLIVESEFEQGSTFSFIINFKKGNPVASLLDDNSKKTASDKTDKLKGIKILVVDDNKINLLVIEKFLKKWGVIYTTASNGQLAVQEAFTTEFDIILMDLQMPIMNGYDASIAIRSSEDFHNKTIPIYAVTASTGEATKKEVLEFGMNGLIGKPFNPEELFETISRVTKKSTG